MLSLLLLLGFAAAFVDALGRLNDFQGNVAGSMVMPPRSGFRLPNGNINGAALIEALSDTMARYNSTGFTKPYIAPPEEQMFALEAFRQGLQNEDLNGTYDKRGVTQRLKNYQDIAYNGYITVGDRAPTRFSMQFDTGSSHIVVPGLKCTPVDGCNNVPRYRGLGTPSGIGVTLNYSGGWIKGIPYTDTVSMAGLDVAEQTIISMTSAKLRANAIFDGIFGMSFTTTDNATTFFENMLTQEVITVPEFSFFIGRAFNSTGNFSTLTLGGRNTSSYSGPLTSIPVAEEPTHWLVNLTSVTVNGVSAGPTVKGRAVIDTGTSFIVVPLPALEAIFAGIPGSVAIPFDNLGNSQYQQYAYPCRTPPTHIPAVTLGQDGASFPIALQDFNLGFLTARFVELVAGKLVVSPKEIEDKNLCVAGMVGLMNSFNPDTFVLGDAFLKGWYSVFSLGEGWVRGDRTGASVGFAQVTQDAVEPNGPVGI